MADEKHGDRLARWARGGQAGSRPVNAATVILLRDGSTGLETLMLRRNSKIAFGGMWVFPGGRVDPGDREGEVADELADACRAAVREAHEEAGVHLEPSELVPFSHWTPPAVTPRRFLTWFFAAAAQDADVVIDRGEIHEHVWLSPAEALRRRDAEEIELAPPTFVSLNEVARGTCVADVLERARSREPERYVTRVATSGAGPIALWHGDAGYADADADKPGPRHRLQMRKSRWEYERDL